MWGFSFMQTFVSIALEVCKQLNITDPKGRGMVMKFSKIYSPQKIVFITKEAQKFPWWRNYPTAAFMKAVGIANKLQKERDKK